MASLSHLSLQDASFWVQIFCGLCHLEPSSEDHGSLEPQVISLGPLPDQLPLFPLPGRGWGPRAARCGLTGGSGAWQVGGGRNQRTLDRPRDGGTNGGLRKEQGLYHHPRTMEAWGRGVFRDLPGTYTGRWGRCQTRSAQTHLHGQLGPGLPHTNEQMQPVSPHQSESGPTRGPAPCVQAVVVVSLHR